MLDLEAFRSPSLRPHSGFREVQVLRDFISHFTRGVFLFRDSELASGLLRGVHGPL